MAIEGKRYEPTTSRLRLEVGISETVRDAAWEAFVGHVPGASYMQTSSWAEVKASVGWRVHRVVAREGGQIVGGMQLLTRTLPMLGGGGYVSNGPVLLHDDPRVMRVLIDELQRVVRDRRLHYVLLQLPAGFPKCAELVQGNAVRQSLLHSAPSATVLVDLSKSGEQLLASMKSKTRYNVRLGLRKGVTIREGTSDDLPTFYQLLQATGERNSFTTQDRSYFETVWDTFDAADRAKMFFAELDGEAISGFLVLAASDTVTYWRGAWGGKAGALHPNEALHWHAIQWAKQSGYRWYDMDGVQVIQLNGVEHGRADTSFKLGFGGEVVMYPYALELVPNAGLRWASAAALGPGATQHTKTIINALRGARVED